MKLVYVLLLASFWSFSVGAKYSTADTTLRIGAERQLFIDDYLIDKLSGGASRLLHHPRPMGVAITHEKPWEGSGSSFHSVFKDGNKYKMYYSAWDFTIVKGKVTDTSHPYNLCYAESNDGVNWVKPNLGLVEFRGSKNNNIVMISGKLGDVYPDLGHPVVFKDSNPNVAPDAKYKAIIRDWSAKSGLKGLLAFKSADGLRWRLISPKVVISDGAFDSQNLAFWDDAKKEYRAYWRYMAGEQHIRSIRTARSKDFINWTDQEDLKYGDAPEIQLYTNVIKNYYRAPQLLIGLPIRYVHRDWNSSMNALPDLENRRLRATGETRFGEAITESLLMVSRDRVNFHRLEEAFLRPGIERTGTWHYGQQYIAWSMVETKSALVGAPNEISLYAVEGFWGTIKKGMDALRRYTIRLDGFVSINSPMKGGELLSKPVTFQGAEMEINFATSAAGEIRVELQDENGKAIPGYSLEECESLYGDTPARKVHWKNGTDVSALQGKVIRMRFAMKDADLYAVKFQ